MPKSLGFMPSPRTLQPHGQKALSFHLDDLEDCAASPNHAPVSQKPKYAKSKSAPLEMLATSSDMQLGVETCAESTGLWVVVDAVQAQQEELAQALDAVVFQVQEQMHVMKAEIARMQFELASERKQRGESEGSHVLVTRGPSVSTVWTARTQEDVPQLPFDSEMLQQNEQNRRADSLKHHIIDIANNVCDMFAEPLNALTESVRRAENDMENLRSALLDVQENQERHSHGANEMQVAVGKLDKMVCQVLDAMKIEESHSKRSAAADAVRAELQVDNDRLLGYFGGKSAVSRLSHPVKLKAQNVSPRLISESPWICGSIESGKHREDRRNKSSTFIGTKETPELWKRIYASSQAATHVGVK